MDVNDAKKNQQKKSFHIPKKNINLLSVLECKIVPTVNTWKSWLLVIVIKVVIKSNNKYLSSLIIEDYHPHITFYYHKIFDEDTIRERERLLNYIGWDIVVKINQFFIFNYYLLSLSQSLFFSNQFIQQTFGLKTHTTPTHK